MTYFRSLNAKEDHWMMQLNILGDIFFSEIFVFLRGKRNLLSHNKIHELYFVCT